MNLVVLSLDLRPVSGMQYTTVKQQKHFEVDRTSNPVSGIGFVGRCTQMPPLSCVLKTALEQTSDSAEVLGSLTNNRDESRVIRFGFGFCRRTQKD